jgi:hypothetical protein
MSSWPWGWSPTRSSGLWSWWLAALDVNPLVAGPDGCVAVDALVVARAG